MAKKILVVDDEQNIRLLLKTIFELEGYDVLLAANGKEALEVLEKEKPALLITDIMMPEMDGWELMKKVRQKVNSSIPIIALTVRSDPMSEKLSREKYGVKTYIIKPFDKKQLIAEVKKYV